VKRGATPSGAPRREGEQGYVLIAAIWLLVLAGAIVAMLMLSSLRLARETRDNGAILHERLAMDAAVETIVADRIINGDRSIWSRAPVDGTLDVEGVAVHVRSTSEADRIDINLSDATVIDAVLRQSGLQAAQREHVLGDLARRRGTAGGIASMVELEALLGAVGGRSTADRFTFVPGSVTKPASAIPVAASLQPGAAQRLTLEAAGGGSRTAIVRAVGQRGMAYLRIDQNMALK
jgi:hypothetical protein